MCTVSIFYIHTYSTGYIIFPVKVSSTPNWPKPWLLRELMWMLVFQLIPSANTKFAKLLPLHLAVSVESPALRLSWWLAHDTVVRGTGARPIPCLQAFDRNRKGVATQLVYQLLPEPAGFGSAALPCLALRVKKNPVNFPGKHLDILRFEKRLVTCPSKVVSHLHQTKEGHIMHHIMLRAELSSHTLRTQEIHRATSIGWC